MIYIKDNFLDKEVFEVVEKNLKEGEFQEVKTPGKSFWIQGAHENIIKYVVSCLEVIEGGNIENVGAFFRQAKKGQDNEWRIHCDIKPIPGKDQPDRAVVLFFSNDKNKNLNGTAFWEHKKHGEKLDMGNIKEYDRILVEDANELSNWNLKSVIGSKKNRLISYPCNYFHSKYPNEAKTPRIVFVMFYKNKGSYVE
tara:strand:- start:50 stop:637 length:588 start_codon:yes stop_codon:yes gene_type:complete